jgi:hypothetical protein
MVATFPTRAQAEAAVDELWHNGFRENQVGYVVPGKGVVEADTRTGGLERRGAEGAVAGAVTGGVLGTVVGALATALIPGVGPVLAGGLLAGAVTGAAAGAAAGGFLGPFIALELSADGARHYNRELEVGRSVVVVQTADRSAEALMILRSHGGEVGIPETTAIRSPSS